MNPCCGDNLTLQIRVENGSNADTGMVGNGCAISQASASLMIDLTLGKPFEEAERIRGLFLKMIRSETDEDDPELDDLEDALSISEIQHTPARVKCAQLSWHTFQEMLSKCAQTEEK